MITVLQEVVLRSREDYGGRMPPEPIGELLVRLPKLVQQAIRIRFEGRSTVTGNRPEWLLRTADVRVVGVTEDRDACVSLDAPILGEAAPELYDQEELWQLRPAPEDTGLDLLADALDDLQRNNADSPRYDTAMLSGLAKMGKVVNGSYHELVIAGRGHRSEAAVVNDTTIVNARELHAMVPAKTRVRVAGQLDMIRLSTRSFAIRLDDGHEVPGVVGADDMADLRDLLGKRVVASGDAVFRASGRLLTVEADAIESAGPRSEVWSHVPQPSGRVIDPRTLRRPQGPRSGLAAIIGQWPGDETDEEIEEALRELS